MFLDKFFHFLEFILSTRLETTRIVKNKTPRRGINELSIYIMFATLDEEELSWGVMGSL
jgi:hypothetical protein